MLLEEGEEGRAGEYQKHWLTKLMEESSRIKGN